MSEPRTLSYGGPPPADWPNNSLVVLLWFDSQSLAGHLVLADHYSPHMGKPQGLKVFREPHPHEIYDKRRLRNWLHDLANVDVGELFYDLACVRLVLSDRVQDEDFERKYQAAFDRARMDAERGAWVRVAEKLQRTMARYDGYDNQAGLVLDSISKEAKWYIQWYDHKLGKQGGQADE